MTTRREFLAGGAAVLASAAVPMSAVATAFSSAPASAPLMAFVVGTPGEFDGAYVRARDAAEALKIWGEQQGHYAGSDECELCLVPEDHDAPCRCSPKDFVTRAKEWDDFEGEPTSGDWLDAGFGSLCHRCNYETMAGDGYNIDGHAVCTDCMTLADWKTEDPDHYEELLDEILTDEYGPDLTRPEWW
jgi:hypothetical protein